MSYKHIRNNIGSISHGTMRPEDVIPALLDCLKSQRPRRREHIKLCSEIQRQLDMPDRDEEPSYFDSDTASDDCESLFEALCEYCLPYFYFGAHPGDGADYGFWLSEDFHQQAKDNDALCVDDLSRVERGFTGEVVLVNDHGNVSLYNYVRGRAYLVWSLV